MLKIFRDIYVNFILKIALLLFVLFVIVSLCIGFGFQGSSCFVLLCFVFISAFLIVVFLVKGLHKKLEEDIDALSSYLKKIDAKEYTAPIEIKNYLEFLELSILLKNLVKRLVKKEKKNLKN